MTLNQKHIAKLRKRIGWSQAAMARALGISNPVTISHWENGHRVPTATAMRLLFLLHTLSDTDLKKIVFRLEQIGEGKISA